jgi:hypothetical protein
MKNYLFIILSLCFMVVAFQACSDKAQQPAQQSQAIPTLENYHQFKASYDAANVQNMRPDVMNPDLSKADYQKLVELENQATAVKAEFDRVLSNDPDLQTQAMLKPYIQTLNARLMVLRSNKAAYERMGLN